MAPQNAGRTTLTSTLSHCKQSHQVRILVTLYQILTPMAFNLGVEFPQQYEEAISSFNVRRR